MKTRGLDVEAALNEFTEVDKLGAAARQIDTTIDLFFNDGDVVSQHTLTAAAHEILFAISRNRGVKGSLKDIPIGLVPDRAEFVKNLKIAENFFKHASRDSNRKIKFPHFMTRFYLFDALRLFVLVGGVLTHRMKVFFMWFQMQYPDVFTFPAAEAELNDFADALNDPAKFKLFARYMISKGEREKRRT